MQILGRTVRLDTEAAHRTIVGALAGLLLLNVAVHLLFIRPAWSRVESADTERAEVDTELRGLRQQVARDQAWLERLDQVEHDLAWFYGTQLATKEERMTAIQGWMRSLATEFGMNPANVTFSHEVDDDSLGLVRWRINFPLEGPYTRLRQFVSRVEQSEYFLIIDRISLAGSREGGAQLSLNIGISTYFEDRDAFPEESRRRRG